MRLKIIQFMCVVLFCAVGCERSLTFDELGVAHGTGEKVYN
jgi:hypothetical protein